MPDEIPTFRAWLEQNQHRAYTFVMFAATPGDWTTIEELHAELHPRRVDPFECVALADAKDAWLAATGKWDFDCADCGVDCVRERYMVRDPVWEAAGMCGFGWLCVGCIEDRLSRRLTAADFLDVPLNHSPEYQRTERLIARLAAT
ncbi:hypothetical protein [Streptomyces phaeoluteigriseus]|uniref:hypothetical protein n=1 Tax=Streptomyces phaeoluteigriseus TaxID=114686 RepID=UPI00367D35B1